MLKKNNDKDIVLEFKNVSLNYGKLAILKNINLSLEPGEIAALVGPSGAGKSSLLMLAGGLENPSTGNISIAGNSYDNKSEDELALLRRQYIGIVFQSFHLNPSLTAQENASVPLELAGKKKPLQQSKDMLTSLGLGDRIHHYPSELSGGEQQRTGIARAFINRPRLVLADEPTGNLDKKTGDMVIKQIFKISKENNASVLLVTHDPHIAKLCSRIITIDEGRIK